VYGFEEAALVLASRHPLQITQSDSLNSLLAKMLSFLSEVISVVNKDKKIGQ